MFKAPNDPLLIFTFVVARVATVLLIVAAVAALAGTIFLALDMVQGTGALSSEYPVADVEVLRMRIWILLPTAAIGFLFAAAFMHILTKIIGSVSEGDPFASINARRLTKMGWLALAFQLIAIPIRMIEGEVDQMTGGGSGDFAVSIGGFVFVLTLFVLARVFAHGAALRDDLEGTI